MSLVGPWGFKNVVPLIASAIPHTVKTTRKVHRPSETNMLLLTYLLWGHVVWKLGDKYTSFYIFIYAYILYVFSTLGWENSEAFSALSPRVHFLQWQLYDNQHFISVLTSLLHSSTPYQCFPQKATCSQILFSGSAPWGAQNRAVSRNEISLYSGSYADLTHEVDPQSLCSHIGKNRPQSFTRPSIYCVKVLSDTLEGKTWAIWVLTESMPSAMISVPTQFSLAIISTEG